MKEYRKIIQPILAYKWLGFEGAEQTHVEKQIFENGHCSKCRQEMVDHGRLIEEPGVLVCPGDWIIEERVCLNFPVEPRSVYKMDETKFKKNMVEMGDATVSGTNNQKPVTSNQTDGRN